MAPESCNFGKDEAEILKPSSSSSSSSSSNSAPFLSMEPPHQAQKTDEGSSDATIASPIKDSSLPKQEEEPHFPVHFSNRCSTCQKKIGLTGFRCRCGDLFCARHRHSDTHGCSFDYKSAGREEISKANPAIRAAKIIKI